MADFELQKAKDLFSDDPEVKAEIAQIETTIKTSSLFANLKQYDAIKILLEKAQRLVDNYNIRLRDQVVKNDEDRIVRAREMAYRDAFLWIIQLFTVEKRLEGAQKRAEEFQKAAGDE
jgi:hypothetical protein